MAKKEIKMATNEQKIELQNKINNLFSSNNLVLDSFSNPKLSLGYGTDDPTQSSQYLPNNRLTWDVNRIMQVEREQPIFRKILNFKASLSLSGIDINSKDLNSEQIRIIKEKLDELYDKLYKLIYQGESFGGSAALICIKGQMSEKELMKPLNIDTINPGDFLGLKVLERWFSCNPTGNLIESINDNGIDDPDLLGEPLYFKVRLGGKGTKSYKVHRSRLLIYNTGVLPELQKRIENYWGVSCLERVWDPLNRYNIVIGAVVNMFLISCTRVLRIDMDTDTAELSEQALNKVTNKLNLMSKALNFSNLLILGENDDFAYESVPMSNVNEVVRRVALDLASSSGCTMSYLFDDGVNDTQTTENAYGEIKTIQKLYMRPIYKTLIKCIIKNEFGSVKDENGVNKMPNFTITFNKLREINDKDVAEVVYKMVMAIVEVFKSGGMDKETFIKSLSEIMQNNNDIFLNYDETYIKEHGKETYNSDQIELAKALNQAKAKEENKEKQEKTDKTVFGGEKNEEKPSPNVIVSEKRKE